MLVTPVWLCCIEYWLGTTCLTLAMHLDPSNTLCLLLCWCKTQWSMPQRHTALLWCAIGNNIPLPQSLLVQWSRLHRPSPGATTLNAFVTELCCCAVVTDQSWIVLHLHYLSVKHSQAICDFWHEHMWRQRTFYRTCCSIVHTSPSPCGQVMVASFHSEGFSGI